MKPPLVAKKFVATPKGKIAYLEGGSPDRPTVLFVHGIPTSSYLWRHVIRLLEGDFHCLAPDLMGLGDTIVDPRTTDFTMPSQAEMLEDFLDALGVGRVHVVAHDQGGAAGQIFAVTNERRLGRLVLTDCVCYDNWPVPAIKQLQRLARPMALADFLCRHGLMEVLETMTPLSKFRRGVVDRKKITNEAIGEYLRPLRGTAGERERFLRFLLAGSPRTTMAVVARLKALRTPVMILWAEEDFYIPVAWGKRLYEDIPGAERFDVIPGAGHFWPEEKPEPFAARIREFLLAGATTRAVGETRADAPAPSEDTPAARSAGSLATAAPYEVTTCGTSAAAAEKPEKPEKQLVRPRGRCPEARGRARR